MTIHLKAEDITPTNHYMILACADSQRSSPDEVIEIIGDLKLSDCVPLFLPDNLTVSGGLYLGDCTSLIKLPDNLTVKGGLYLSGCTSLAKLPDNLTVGSDLYLAGCTSLTKLPDNLTVNGGLNLSGCTSLVKLPDNLTVNGNIWVNDDRVREFRKNNPKFADKIG